jgi:hypothetical protein
VSSGHIDLAIRDGKFKMAVYMATDGWTCRTCGKQLSRPDHLREHERLHTGQKPFRCNECRSWFRLRLDRDNHQLSHDGPIAGVCRVCGALFSRRYLVNRHIMSVHGLLSNGSLPPKEQPSTSDHDSFSDDKRGSTPTRQGGDDVRCRQSPRFEHRVPQTDPKRRRHAVSAMDEIAAWYDHEELVEKTAGHRHRSLKPVGNVRHVSPSVTSGTRTDFQLQFVKWLENYV